MWIPFQIKITTWNIWENVGRLIAELTSYDAEICQWKVNIELMVKNVHNNHCIVYSLYRFFCFSLSLRYCTQPQRVVYLLWSIKCKTTSFWRPRCSYTYEHAESEEWCPNLGNQTIWGGRDCSNRQCTFMCIWRVVLRGGLNGEDVMGPYFGKTIYSSKWRKTNIFLIWSELWDELYMWCLSIEKVILQLEQNHVGVAEQDNVVCWVVSHKFDWIKNCHFIDSENYLLNW